jgi:OmcA/MtrC family decaheme c-type cytochrome
VTFRVAVNAAPHDVLTVGNELSTLRFTFAAPTTDYAGYAQYTAQSSSPGAVGVLAATATPGELTWTASQTIDNIAAGVAAAPGTQPFPLTGTMAVGMEGRLTRRATAPDGTQIPSINYPMHNDVFYVALTDPTAVPRREATVVENCNTCHGDLRAHGGSRNDPEYCVMCHTAGRDSITRMTPPTPGNLARTTTLRLSTMVHRIHTGEEGARDYFDFAELRFPGDRRNCAHCHVPGQYELPLPGGLLASRTSDIDSTRARIDDYYMGATAAACAGCHDSESAEVHAATMSIIGSGPSAISESCASCHASGREFGLDVVHARPGL